MTRRLAVWVLERFIPLEGINLTKMEVPYGG
jgi:hypothetical protein